MKAEKLVEIIVLAAGIIIGVLLLALIVLTGTPEALAGLVGVLAALLGSASYNAWSLLVQVRESDAGSAPPAANREISQTGSLSAER